ncbi:hypothetical protein [Saccharothrix obliqua]|uniref:hypothetical protein n=1 Tax=Saccharothrix obliqua TaxID=2861747 RepID=UPI001C5E8043|nr:hypothetical protein [Saccharothrix obliqua]MBW4717403.1 hypothetical protein [Saccharothrix obliqua]
MTEPIAHLDFTLIPAYKLITLRDADNDAGTDSANAVTAARRDGIHSTGSELYIHCPTDTQPITITLTVTAQPSQPHSPTFEVECPSGLIVLGTPTGEQTDLTLPGGAGVYTGHVTNTAGHCRILLWRTSTIADYDEDED